NRLSIAVQCLIPLVDPVASHARREEHRPHHLPPPRVASRSQDPLLVPPPADRVHRDTGQYISHRLADKSGLLDIKRPTIRLVAEWTPPSRWDTRLCQLHVFTSDPAGRVHRTLVCESDHHPSH